MRGRRVMDREFRCGKEHDQSESRKTEETFIQQGCRGGWVWQDRNGLFHLLARRIGLLKSIGEGSMS